MPIQQIKGMYPKNAQYSPQTLRRLKPKTPEAPTEPQPQENRPRPNRQTEPGLMSTMWGGFWSGLTNQPVQNYEGWKRMRDWKKRYKARRSVFPWRRNYPSWYKSLSSEKPIK